MPYCEECGNWIEKGILCENCKYIKGLTDKHMNTYRLAYPIHPRSYEKSLIKILKSKHRN